MLPSPRLEAGVAALGQRLVVLGGFDTDLAAGLHITTEVDVLDTFDSTWTQLPDAPVAWTHAQLAAIDSTLYLLGGFAGQQYVPHGEAWKLDTLTSPLAWTPLATMPPGLERGSAAVVVAPPRIYLLGGASMMGALKSNLYYDITTDSWGTDLPDLPAARSHLAGMRRVDGALVVAGGLAGIDSSAQAADTWLLRVGQPAWETRMPMPDARGGCAYGAVQGQLVCAGGEGGMSVFDYNESYDPLLDMWTVLEKVPARRGGTPGAVVGQRLYVPGGSDSLITFEPTSTLYIFSPLDTAP